MEYQFGVYVHVIDSYCECTIFITQQNTYRSLTSRQSNRQTTTIKKNVRRNKNEAQTSWKANKINGSERHSEDTDKEMAKSVYKRTKEFHNELYFGLVHTMRMVTCFDLISIY